MIVLKSVIKSLPDQAIARLIDVSLSEMIVADVSSLMKGNAAHSNKGPYTENLLKFL